MRDPSASPNANGAPARPVALYEGPRLTLFRGWALVALVAACVGAGAVLHMVWPTLVAWVLPAEAAPPMAQLPPPGASSVRIGAGTLLGQRWGLDQPDGGAHEERFPPAEPTLVNVWLENCADCIPAFEAWRAAAEQGALKDVPVINVAYGTSSSVFARTFHTDERLVFDSGALFVQPLGIGTFTSLLIDANGNVLLRDSPAVPGFSDRVRGALAVARHADALEQARRFEGRWRGSYTCQQGETALTIDLSVKDAEVRAVFNFSPLAKNPDVPSGQFRMRGSYQPGTRALALYADESDWIDQPPNYVTVDLVGTLNVDHDVFAGRVDGASCGGFTLLRDGLGRR